MWLWFIPPPWYRPCNHGGEPPSRFSLILLVIVLAAWSIAHDMHWIN
jgi:hypothetical protein